MAMQHKGKRAATEEHAGMHEYHGQMWGRDVDPAVYDLDQVREVSDFEKAALSFEDAVGAWAFREGEPFAERLCNKVLDYLAVKHLQADALASQLDEKLAALSPHLKVLGNTNPHYAGSIGDNVDDIKGVLTDGNLRERLLVVEQYAKKVLADDVMDQDGLLEILAKAESLKMDVEGSLITGDFGAWTTPWETGSHNEDKTVVATGYSFRAKSGDLDVQPVEDDKKIGQKAAQTPLPTADQRGGDNPIGKYEGALQESQGAVAGSQAEGETMKWANPTADMIMNEADAWVKKQREVGMPLRGGPSGHAHKFMMVNQILGMPNTADEMRVACLGHLLPIKAHSYIEVLEGAKALGASPYPNSALVYRNLAPYGESLSGLVGAPFPDTTLTPELLAEAGLIEPNALDLGLVAENRKADVTADSDASLATMNGTDASEANVQ